jgi:lysophospholipase L1-like esterase
MTSKHDFYICSYYVKSQKENVERRKIVIDTYERAKAEGDKNVYFIEGRDLLKGENREDCTVDGVHPNENGAKFIAEHYARAIKKII